LLCSGCPDETIDELPNRPYVALALGDDPATKQNANDENAASVEIEPSEPSSFRRHRSSIKRQKQQNSRRMTEWGILARQLQLQLHQRYPRTQHQLFRDHLVLCSRRSEEHTSELQSLAYLVCRLLLEKKKK